MLFAIVVEEGEVGDLDIPSEGLAVEPDNNHPQIFWRDVAVAEGDVGEPIWGRVIIEWCSRHGSQSRPESGVQRLQFWGAGNGDVQNGQLTGENANARGFYGKGWGGYGRFYQNCLQLLNIIFRGDVVAKVGNGRCLRATHPKLPLQVSQLWADLTEMWLL